MFANPAKAIEATKAVLISRFPIIGPKFPYETNSFKTILEPNNSPTTNILSPLNPINAASGENAYDNICNATSLNESHTDYGNKLKLISQEVSDNGGEVKCYALGGSYCVYSVLNGPISSEFFCFDSAGNAKKLSTDPQTDCSNNHICP